MLIISKKNSEGFWQKYFNEIPVIAARSLELFIKTI